MENRNLEINGFYRHFKGKLYQVRCIAYHSETKEKMVVYQALYGDYSVYVRPYDMFMSEVDHVKYPDVTQHYRFEQVKLNGDDMPHNIINSYFEKKESESEKADFDNDTIKSEAFENKTLDNAVFENETFENEEKVDLRLLEFLDAETYKDKLNTLTSLRTKLDDKLIDAMAASLDVEVPQADIEKRYMSLRSCIMTRMKYERSRSDR